ncbi:FMN-binding protein [Lactovum miscens]|uniref:FMN-binding protein n=1 Tax=Lactovum miscens TaxID=190387 RepID=UPI002ED77E05
MLKKDTKMKKLVSIIVTTLIGIVAVVDGYWFFSKNVAEATNLTTVSSSSSVTSGAQSSTTLETSNGSGSSSTISSGYKDGTYTGKSIATQWGNVQVEVTISGGQISNIIMLKSTSSDGIGRSRQIDTIAEPQYISKAKSANSAKIQAISGATVTYDGFTNSLQNALTQAV